MSLHVFRVFRPLVLSCIGCAFLAASPAWAGVAITLNGQPANASIAPNYYHNQITTYYCGAAAVEMQLDSNAWRNNLLPAFSAAGINNQGFAQPNIYGVSHGNSGPGWATDPNGMVAALNAATAGAAGVFQQDDDTALNTANRNIANALELTGAPVSVLINHSAHWIDVYAAITDVAPAVDQAYKIYGFQIRDPWYAAGGLGPNTYLANNARAWGRYFNTANAQAGAPWSGKYVSITDPPALDNGLDSSDPGAYPTVPTITDPSVAASDAATDTTNDTEFNGDEQPGGSFKSADSEFIQEPGDTGAAGDWLVPYEDNSGVGGFELIDDTTGQIDQATWFDAGSEQTLPQIDQNVADEFNGNLVNDAEPEPASLTLLVLGGTASLTRRAKRAAR
jgi:hypothetical protein